MSTMAFEQPKVISFFFDPAAKIESALRDFCHKHGVPARQTDDAVILALGHRERGNSVASAVEFGKGHVRLWLRMNDPNPPEAA